MNKKVADIGLSAEQIQEWVNLAPYIAESPHFIPQHKKLPLSREETEVLGLGTRSITDAIQTLRDDAVKLAQSGADTRTPEEKSAAHAKLTQDEDAKLSQALQSIVQKTGFPIATQETDRLVKLTLDSVHSTATELAHHELVASQPNLPATGNGADLPARK